MYFICKRDNPGKIIILSKHFRKTRIHSLFLIEQKTFYLVNYLDLTRSKPYILQLYLTIYTNHFIVRDCFNTVGNIHVFDFSTHGKTNNFL